MQYKYIELQNGGKTIVDADDYEKFNKCQWFRNSHGYAYRQGWAPASINQPRKHWTIWLHREINQTTDGLFTDHINGNKLDNRKENLRSVTKSENGANRGKPRLTQQTSQFKGVSFHPSTGLWRCRCGSGGTVENTYHRTQEQAALDYNRMAKAMFGECAQLNVIPDGVQPTVRKQKTSQYRGVGFNKKSGKWRASIDIDGTTKWIGHYNTEQEAALAFNNAALQHRGPLAEINSIET